MNKHLKEIDFENKVNVSFTKENKQDTINKIKQIEEKRRKKHHLRNTFTLAFSLAFSLGIIVIGLVFISNKSKDSKDLNTEPNHTVTLNQPDEDHPIDVVEFEDKEIRELIVGGHYSYYWDPETLSEWDSRTHTLHYYDYTDSNYNLFVAHLRAATITDNAFLWGERFKDGLDDTDYQTYLESIQLFLNRIELAGAGKEKLDEFNRVDQLVEQAIKNRVEQGDPILDEIHHILHELDEYYNAKPFIDGKTDPYGWYFEFSEKD